MQKQNYSIIARGRLSIFSNPHLQGRLNYPSVAGGGQKMTGERGAEDEHIATVVEKGDVK